MSSQTSSSDYYQVTIGPPKGPGHLTLPVVDSTTTTSTSESSDALFTIQTDTSLLSTTVTSPPSLTSKPGIVSPSLHHSSLPTSDIPIPITSTTSSGSTAAALTSGSSSASSSSSAPTTSSSTSDAGPVGAPQGLAAFMVLAWIAYLTFGTVRR